MSALVIMAVVMGVRTQMVHTSVLVHLATYYHPISALVEVICIFHYQDYWKYYLMKELELSLSN